MKDFSVLRTRYERDPIEVQIGGLASNLSRISWHIRQSGTEANLRPLFRESKYFAEWAASHASLKIQGVLAEVQVDLAIWERKASSGQLLPTYAEQSEAWAQSLLSLAGFI